MAGCGGRRDGASAQGWLNTAGQPINATTVYTDPVGGIFTQPVVLTFALPTLTAIQFYTDDAVTLGGGFTSSHSGTLTCTGGGVNLATAIGIPTHSLDISFLVDPINAIIDALNKIPGIDISHIPTSVSFGGETEPVSFDLISGFC